MIWMALSKLLIAFSNRLAFMLVFPRRMNKGATGFTRVARSRTSMACKSNKDLRQKTQILLRNLICWPGKATIMNKSPRDTNVLQQIICVSQLKFEKSTVIILKASCCSSSPPNVETQEKYPVLVRWGECLGRWSCIRAWRVCKSTKSAN